MAEELTSSSEERVGGPKKSVSPLAQRQRLLADLCSLIKTNPRDLFGSFPITSSLPHVFPHPSSPSSDVSGSHHIYTKFPS